MANNRRTLLIVFVTVFIDLLGFGIVLPLLPLYAKQLTSSGLVIGLLMSSFSAMQFLFSPIWGRVSDRVGRRPILLIGLFGSVIFYALFGYASSINSLLLMFIARIGAGISGATISTAAAVIADTTPPERRSAGMALIGAAFGIGFTFGPILGFAALWLDPGSIQPIGVMNEAGIEAVVNSETPTVATAAGERLSSAPGYLASVVSLMAFLLATAILPESLDPNSKADRADWFDSKNLSLALSNPKVTLCIFSFFLGTLGFAMFESTVSLIGKEVFLMSARQTFILFAYIGITVMVIQGGVVRRLSGKFSDEILARSGVVILMAGQFGAIIGISLGSVVILLAILIPVVLGWALMTTSLQGLISKNSRADQQGGILGVNQAGSALARILGPVIGIVSFNTAYRQWGNLGASAPYVLGIILMAYTVFLLTGLKVDKKPINESAG